MTSAYLINQSVHIDLDFDGAGLQGQVQGGEGQQASILGSRQSKRGSDLRRDHCDFCLYLLGRRLAGIASLQDGEQLVDPILRAR